MDLLALERPEIAAITIIEFAFRTETSMENFLSQISFSISNGSQTDHTLLCAFWYQWVSCS